MTKNKLFSNSHTSFHAEPNSQVSYYDAAIPGTQPRFNWQALLLALKAGRALSCEIAEEFSFDRKHYFYGDQPAGYQITQHYRPFAKNGKLQLFPRDGVESEFYVRIKQIQIEQDTGKSTYIDENANIDLNRTNTGLIELVTEPDIPTPEAAGVFVRKLQVLLQHLGVCSGELETGAMRVDVNVSVNGGQRCEIKNLSSTSAIVHAIRAEFKRQKKEIMAGGAIHSETRGWDGKKTWKLRSKEEGVDYRYMPDPEIQPLKVSREVLEHIDKRMPVLPDEIFKNLLEPPYSVPLKDARTLMSIPGLVDYYHSVYEYVKYRGVSNLKVVSNWIVHRYLGELNSQELEFSHDLISVEKFGDLVIMVEQDEMTATSAGLLIRHIVSTQSQESIHRLVEQLELGKVGGDSLDAIKDLCQAIIYENPVVAEQVRSGKKPKSIMFLVGQVMRECQGRINAEQAKAILLDLLTA